MEPAGDLPVYNIYRIHRRSFGVSHQKSYSEISDVAQTAPPLSQTPPDTTRLAKATHRVPHIDSECHSDTRSLPSPPLTARRRLHPQRHVAAKRSAHVMCVPSDHSLRPGERSACPRLAQPSARVPPTSSAVSESSDSVALLALISVFLVVLVLVLTARSASGSSSSSSSPSSDGSSM
jgi:hypothetical protein